MSERNKFRDTMCDFLGFDSTVDDTKIYGEIERLQTFEHAHEGAELPFHASVRDALDLDWSKREEQMLAEIRRLKDVERRVEALANGIQ